MRYVLSMVLGLSALLGPSAAQAFGGTITTLYSTGQGLNASGPHGTYVDPHWALLSSPVGSTVTGTDAYTTPAGSNNVAPASGTQWIAPSPNNSLTEPEGDYDYQTTFSLSGFIAPTAVITGEFAADNSIAEVLLNGHVVSGISGGSLKSFTDFTISSGFVSGENTLDFVVFNGPQSGTRNNPTALLVDFTSATATAIPEPCSLVLGAIGAVVLGCCHRRFRRLSPSTP